MLFHIRRMLLGLTAGALLGAGAEASPAGGYRFDLSVTPHAVTRPLSSSFLGLALEYGTVRRWTADASRRNLDPARPAARPRPHQRTEHPHRRPERRPQLVAGARADAPRRRHPEP